MSAFPKSSLPSNLPAGRLCFNANALPLSLAEGDYHAPQGRIMMNSQGIPEYHRQIDGQIENPRGNTDRTEWLLTAGDGSFAMGTVAGVLSRRYHGLLIASLQPPVRRLMALSAMAESVVLDADTASERRFDLSCFRFRPGELHPRGDAYLTSFDKDVTCRWTYNVGPVQIVKELLLARNPSTLTPGGAIAGAYIRYHVLATPGARPARNVKLVLRPLVAMRDFHGLILRDTVRDRYRISCEQRAITITVPEAKLTLTANCGKTFDIQQWWYNFQYDQELARGYDYLEDLLHPGSFAMDWAWPAGPTDTAAPQPIGTITIAAGVNGTLDPADFDTVKSASISRISELVAPVLAKVKPADRDAAGSLTAAADDFIARRVPPPGAIAPSIPSTTSSGKPESGDQVTILAGYPWFADWGRDAMIALPGLLLATGRYSEASRILQTFAHHRGPEGSEYYGLVPNVFDDYTGKPHYNTVDASLWFVHAACQYLGVSGDTATFHRELLPACIDVVTAYERGTAFRIKMDPADGLISAGDAGTQLTWMDAKRDGVVFTPRHGKAVEINALWYNALRSLESASGPHRPGLRQKMAAMAVATAAGFVRTFTDTNTGGLIDVVTPKADGQWFADHRIRPNQIFAASLPFSPLSLAQRQSVTNLVRMKLLTPGGVATLDPADAGFKGRYKGRMFDRDAAYHNGTAWPWLLGPLAEAVLRSGEFSAQSKLDARQVLSGILGDLDKDCVGQLAEVFDGENTAADPQHSAGCPAQAWSVAEALRVLMLVQ